jgi:hypothetical protein
MKCLISILLCVLLSCQKEDDFGLGICRKFDHCEAVNSSNCGGLDINFVNSALEFEGPSFNPLNPKEFVYVKVENVSDHSLWIHDLHSGEDRWIVNTPSCQQPIWTKQNQIVWTSVSGIYRINPDGTDLFRLDAAAASNHSVPSPDGMLVYGYHHPNNEVNIGLIFNLQGVIVDTTAGGWACDWHEDAVLFGRGVGSIFEFDLTMETIHSIHSPVNYITPGNILDAKWRYGHEEVIFSAYQEGLYSYSLVTGEVTQLKMSCKSTFINSISISPDGEAMLLEVEIWKQRGEECTVDVYNEIWLAHISGCGTTQVLY